jgi:hypothetical protein
MGELGWSLERWKNSTFVEFNYAAAGYWRNWERFAALPMREICYVQIAGNPNIKQSSKPVSSQEYMKLSIDGEKKVEKPTDEEIEQARKDIFYGKTRL